MSQVDVAERKRSWDERAVVRVELAFDPVRPHPVKVLLNGSGIDQPAGVKNDAGSQ